MIKCVAYVSRVSTKIAGANIPIGLSQILNSSRKNNKEKGITGVLSYRDGFYIQVLEGSEEAVNSLFSKILADSRHHEVTVILNEAIEQRSFSGWYMRLLDSVAKDRCFRNFIARYKHVIDDFGDETKSVVSHFLVVDDYGYKPSSGYRGKTLFLTGWPSFRAIKRTTVTAELCARLTRHHISYESLLDSHDFGTKQQVDAILDQFDVLGLLEVSESVADSLEQKIITDTNPHGSFYSKMRHFLGVRG